LDLPFAQQRFCDSEHISNLTAVSDAYDRSFGANYGTLLEGMPVPLLTRALFVLDEKNVLRHVEYVAELTNEPDYGNALRVVRDLLGN
jgi:thiol peroxidase